jgi:HD-GYP domain-containing protein (c-di-GMP phosphodiesterase class II)
MADICDALSAKRPYRDALPIERVLQIMAADVPHALDHSCFEVLKTIASQHKSDVSPAVEVQKPR